ncbi:hypothetical protein [Cardiobacterium valvarum]|uniref:Uncharacterized protein n=1 Tax=Cardiobacterium valvarum F0432 TaxID=797473 RepID=G9ZID3_9GAMM|nr:hypothetical protein [Cardiobacterium valvarum]EHM52169.1 hypothetical protein HMPREF9080_02543 [Cardiobacterium valvarum F0432]
MKNTPLPRLSPQTLSRSLTAIPDELKMDSKDKPKAVQMFNDICKETPGGVSFLYRG